MRNPVSVVSDYVRHKPYCTATNDSYRLQDIGSRVALLSMERKEGADQLRSFEHLLCFWHMKNRFILDAAHSM